MWRRKERIVSSIWSRREDDIDRIDKGEQACNFPRLHNWQTLGQLSNRKGQMWSRDKRLRGPVIYIYLASPYFPDRVSSVDGIERGRVSSLHRVPRMLPWYTSPSLFVFQGFHHRKPRNRITLSRNEGIPPSHIFISLLRHHSIASSFFNSSGWKGLFYDLPNVPRIFSSSFNHFKISC